MWKQNAFSPQDIGEKEAKEIEKQQEKAEHVEIGEKKPFVFHNLLAQHAVHQITRARLDLTVNFADVCAHHTQTE